MSHEHQPACQTCHKTSGVRKAFRLDPVNWQPEYKRLCTMCRNRLGYHVEERNLMSRRGPMGDGS